MASIETYSKSTGKKMWRVVWREGGRGSGKQSQSFDKYPAAVAYKAEIEGRKYRGLTTDMTGAKQPFGPYAQQWIETRVAPKTGSQLRPQTIQGYHKLLRLYLEPEFGQTALRQITTQDVRVWYATSCRHSELQTKKAYRLLHAVMTTAHQEHGVAIPHIVGAGQEHYEERQLLTDTQVLALAQEIAPRLHAFVMLSAFGGLRPPGELRALRRRDVNPTTKTVTVRESASDVKGMGRIVGEPKTNAGKRTVKLPEFLMDILILHMTELTGPDPDAWVFTNPLGGPLYPAYLYGEFNKARAKLAIPGITLYNLRHYAATWKSRAPGMTDKNLMSVMGWSSYRSAQPYLHAEDEVDQAAVDYIETRIRKVSNASPHQVP